MQYEISVSPKFQVTIPKEIRKLFSEIQPYSKVRITYDEGSNQIIINTQSSIERTKGALGKPPRYGNLKGKKLGQKVLEERALYYAKKYGNLS